MFKRMSLFGALLIGIFGVGVVNPFESAIAAPLIGGDFGLPWKDTSVASFEECKARAKELAADGYTLKAGSCVLLDPPADWTADQRAAWGPEYTCTYEKTSSTFIYGCSPSLEKLPQELYTRIYSCREFTNSRGKRQPILIKDTDSKSVRTVAVAKYTKTGVKLCDSTPWEQSKHVYRFGLCTRAGQASLGAVLTTAFARLSGGKVYYSSKISGTTLAGPDLLSQPHTLSDTQYCSGPGGVPECKWASPYSTTVSTGSQPERLYWPPPE